MLYLVNSWFLVMFFVSFSLFLACVAVAFFLIPLMEERHEKRMIELERADSSLDAYLKAMDNLQSHDLSDELKGLIVSFNGLIDSEEFSNFLIDNKNAKLVHTHKIQNDITSVISRIKNELDQSEDKMLEDTFEDFIKHGLIYNTGLYSKLNQISPDTPFSLDKIRQNFMEIIELIINYIKGHPEMIHKVKHI